MANIDIVAGGAGLNGTWARDGSKERSHPPDGAKLRRADPESNPMNVAERASASVWHAARPGRDNARRRVCYGARSNVIEEPVHE
jgi:hypothetical protein